MSPAVAISCRLPRSQESENARFISIVLETLVYPRISPTYNPFVFKTLPWLLVVLSSFTWHLKPGVFLSNASCLHPLCISAQPLSASGGFLLLLRLRVGSSLHHPRSAHLVTLWTPLPSLKGSSHGDLDAPWACHRLMGLPARSRIFSLLSPATCPGYASL